MPHIHTSAVDMEKTIKIMNVHVYIQFNKEYYQSPKAKLKLEEIRAKVAALVNDYFPDAPVEAEMSNHEYNVFNKC